MNLHLVNDEKFINTSYKTFENYYPDQNIFYVNLTSDEFKYIKKNDRIHFSNFSDKEKTTFQINSLFEKYKFKRVLVHYLDKKKGNLAIQLKKKFNIEIYWIFYGSDLYTPLKLHRNYKINDYSITENFNLQNVFYKFLIKIGFSSYLLKDFNLFNEHVDYFCFWNKFDFQLLSQNFETKAKFKFFFYDGEISLNELKKKELGILSINHSASLDSNHKTIIEKISNPFFLNSIKKVIIPLSYGSEEVRNSIIQYANEKLGDKSFPLINFLPISEYYELVNQVSVAIWGSRRQEGGGNVFYMLANGTKVFLRESNNLFQLFKENGFDIYSFENDLINASSLEPLSLKSAEHNRAMFIKMFGKEAFDKTYLNLFNPE